MLLKPRKKWKVIPDFPKYEINQIGEVRYSENKTRLPIKKRFGKVYYELHDDENIVRLRYAHEILSTIPEFSF